MEVTIKGRTVTLAAPASHAARTKALLALAQDGQCSCWSEDGVGRW